MTPEIILAFISLLIAIVGLVRWYYKDRRAKAELELERAITGDLLDHQKRAKLCIKEAERRAENGKRNAEDILAGHMSLDNLNRVRSGKRPQDS
jgi:hypothetical protein